MSRVFFYGNPFFLEIQEKLDLKCLFFYSLGFYGGFVELEYLIKKDKDIKKQLSLINEMENITILISQLKLEEDCECKDHPDFITSNENIVDLISSANEYLFEAMSALIERLGYDLYKISRLE